MRGEGHIKVKVKYLHSFTFYCSPYFLQSGGLHSTECVLVVHETETDKNGLYMIVWRYSYCTEPPIPLGIVAIVSVSGSVDAALMT